MDSLTGSTVLYLPIYHMFCHERIFDSQLKNEWLHYCESLGNRHFDELEVFYVSYASEFSLLLTHVMLYLINIISDAIFLHEHHGNALSNPLSNKHSCPLNFGLQRLFILFCIVNRGDVSNHPYHVIKSEPHLRAHFPLHFL